MILTEATAPATASVGEIVNMLETITGDKAKPKALSQDETVQLAEYELVIHDHLTGFLAVGSALKAIKESKLYRAWGTFEDYLQGRWHLKRQRAYELIDAAAVASMSEISDIAPIEVESHAAALADVPEDRRTEVWKEVNQSGEKITAKKILDAAAVVDDDDNQLDTAAGKLTPKERSTLKANTAWLLANIRKSLNQTFKIEEAIGAPDDELVQLQNLLRQAEKIASAKERGWSAIKNKRVMGRGVEGSR